MSGLVDALLGGLAGGAGYVAQDAARRQGIEDRQAEKAADREAVFQDFVKRMNFDHDFRVGNLEKDALAQAAAETAGYAARGDLRKQQADAAIAQQRAADQYELDDPTAKAKHDRDIKDKLKLTSAGQAGTFANLEWQKSKDAQERRDREAVATMGARLGSGQVQDPVEVSGLIAGILAKGGNAAAYMPPAKGRGQPFTAEVANTDPSSKGLSPTVKRTVEADGRGGYRPIQIIEDGQAPGNNSLPNGLQKPTGRVNDNLAIQMVRRAETQAERDQVTRQLALSGWTADQIKALIQKR